MRIREATPADWDQIWPIWREVVEAGETYAFPPGLSKDEATGWWMDQPPGVVFVAVDDGPEGERVLGSAKSGPNRPGPGAHVSTASFMVGSLARGRGVGRALGEHVLAWATAQGYASMQFNAVVETNTAAVALWRDLGFEVIGTVPEAFRRPDGSLVGLHVMFRRL